jgi:metal-sulfur cluster biosynthetic enzyme
MSDSENKSEASPEVKEAANATSDNGRIPTKDQIFEALMPIQDPEIRIGVVDLGLIYDAEVTEAGAVTVKMTLTTPACPYGEMLVSQVHKAVEEFPGVTDAKVDLVWEPVWDPREMASDFAKDQLGIW